MNRFFKIMCKAILIAIIIMILCAFITCISFCFTFDVLEWNMYLIYFDPKLFLLNFLPILFLLLLIYLCSKKLYISFLISALFILVFGIANQTKITFRDDVIHLSDFTIIKEAFIMSKGYGIVIKKYAIIAFVLILISTILLKKAKMNLNIKLFPRIILIVLLCTLGAIGYQNIYTNSKIYNSVGDKTRINKWIAIRQSQIRGLVYPFIFNARTSFFKAPDGYDKNKTGKVLNNYKYQGIPKDKKVNVIGIMLEAFNDLSKFEQLDFVRDPYKSFHEIQKKSISGTLVTYVYGGGTNVTERNFLTGNYLQNEYRKRTNSFVRYFKKEGYTVEAMHPCYGAFYNRNTVNSNLGFDIYYNYENKFNKSLELNKTYGGMADDEYVFNEIYNSYLNSKKNKNPYFNFTVTYQNHGPYSKEDILKPNYYINSKNKDKKSFNILNNYLHYIENTGDELLKLINKFEDEDEPVVIVLFGDHNPYVESAFSDFDINIDLSTVEGFLNYYQTPYVIYGNTEAKKLLNRDFLGKGDNISPIFLMNELFNYIGYTGDEYMQYLSDLKRVTPIISDYFYYIDNEYINTKKAKINNKINEFYDINYYWLTNFKY